MLEFSESCELESHIQPSSIINDDLDELEEPLEEELEEPLEEPLEETLEEELEEPLDDELAELFDDELAEFELLDEDDAKL
jgi:hypothetical protein